MRAPASRPSASRIGQSDAEFSARLHRIEHGIADAMVALMLAICGALALVHFFSPCVPEGALC